MKPLNTNLTPMVNGGEALRLKNFLSSKGILLSKIFHQLPIGEEEASKGRISTSVLIGVLEAAMKDLRQPSLPIDFGSTIRVEDMGIYGLVIQTAPTLGDAFDRSVKFQRLMTTSAKIELERQESSLRWIWKIPDATTLGARVRNEVVLSEHVALLRLLTTNFKPTLIRFTHKAPCDDIAHRKYFGCPISWGADENSVSWPTKDLDRSLGVDLNIGNFFERDAKLRIAQLPEIGIVPLVTDVVLKKLSTGNVSLKSTAAALGLSSRTLRRDLVTAGFTFRELIDEIRQKRAVELASDGQRSMTEIAIDLGFSEVSAFCRAWKRWFKQSFKETRSAVANSTYKNYSI
jgi:AraC-like DNA-binding protein